MIIEQPKRPPDDPAQAASQNWKWSVQLAEKLNMLLEQLERVGVTDLQVAGGDGTQLIDKTVSELSRSLDTLRGDDARLRSALQEVNSRPYVLQSDQYGNWNWRKWSDGTAECWGDFPTFANFDGTDAGGMLYATKAAWSEAYPEGLFTYAPSCQITPDSDISLWMIASTAGTVAKTPGVKFYKTTQASGVPVILHVTARGTWK